MCSHYAHELLLLLFVYQNRLLLFIHFCFTLIFYTLLLHCECDILMDIWTCKKITHTQRDTPLNTYLSVHIRMWVCVFVTPASVHPQLKMHKCLNIYIYVYMYHTYICKFVCMYEFACISKNIVRLFTCCMFIISNSDILKSKYKHVLVYTIYIFIYLFIYVFYEYTTLFIILRATLNCRSIWYFRCALKIEKSAVVVCCC